MEGGRERDVEREREMERRDVKPSNTRPFLPGQLLKHGDRFLSRCVEQAQRCLVHPDRVEIKRLCCSGRMWSHDTA